MTYEARPNGTHAISCNVPMCKSHILGPTEDEVFEDANLAGWIEEQGGQHCCPNCARGIHTGATQIKAMFGGKDVIDVMVTAPVHAGEPFVGPDGSVVGHYEADALPGNVAKVKLALPTVAAKVPVSAKYAAILGRAPAQSVPVPSAHSAARQQQMDELFDAFEPKSEPRPAPSAPSSMDDEDPFDLEPSKPAPVSVAKPSIELDPSKLNTRREGKVSKTALQADPGTDGGAGLVKAAPAVDQAKAIEAKKAADQLKAKREQEKARKLIDVDSLVKSQDLFGFLGEDKGWTPDDK